MKFLLFSILCFISLNSFTKDYNLSLEVPLTVNPGVIFKGEKKYNETYSYGVGWLRYDEEFYIEFNVQQYHVFLSHWCNKTFESSWVLTGALSYTKAVYEDSEFDINEKREGFGYGLDYGYLWHWSRYNHGIRIHVRGYTFDNWVKYRNAYASGNHPVPHHFNSWLSWTIGFSF